MRVAPKRSSIWSFFVPLAVALAASACGSDIGGAGPCEGDQPAAACGEECAGDGDCSSGFYCGADGTCTADCTAGGDECGAGLSCDPSGHCTTSGTDGGGDDCPNINVTLTPQTPTVVLLIDRSGSMSEDFGDDDRWSAVQSALADPDDGVLPALEDNVIFGATLYNSVGGNDGPDGCPILHSVTPALGNASAIGDLFTDYGPDSDTPTAESVQAVTASFPEADGPRVLVLATDGNPDNCEDHDAHTVETQMMSETAVEDAYSAGIETFVLSVGDEVSEPHLQRLANAGQGEPLDTGGERFFVAEDQQALIDAFSQIIGGARSCEIDVDGTVDLGKADQGNVSLNGSPLEHGTDWTMIDGNTLELLGDACDTFLSTPEVNLEADFPCGVVVL